MLTTIILFLPLLGALIAAVVPKDEDNLARGVGYLFSLATFVLSCFLLRGFDSSAKGMQLGMDVPWIESLGVHYKIGIDGFSLWLVLLATFLTPICLFSAHHAVEKKVRGFVSAMLVLETGMLGAFLAQDLFLFYVFWEVMLIPMYFIIGVWGGDRRIYASYKFVIYTMVGSLLMLVAIFYLYVTMHSVSGVWTFDLEQMKHLVLSRPAQIWCFVAFALAFAIKVPMWPLHTWLPDAHVQAPTAGSVILAGVLLKFGAYGFLRFAIPLFPYAVMKWTMPMAVLATVGIIYGAVTAYAQDDMKRLVAYSSVSHLGFVMLGIFAWNMRGVEGAVFTMLSHGLTTGGLFLSVGILYERRHKREIREYGGIAAVMPRFASIFLICTLGAIGLPALSGFVGEFTVLTGMFDAGDTTPAGITKFLQYPHLITIIATSAVILGAIYMLVMYQKVMLGKNSNPKNQKLRDLSFREVMVFLPVVIGIFWLGLFPRPVLSRMDVTTQAYIEDFHGKMHDLHDGVAEAHLYPAGYVVPGAPVPVPAPTPGPAQPSTAGPGAPAPAAPAPAAPAPSAPQAMADPAGGGK